MTFKTVVSWGLRLLVAGILLQTLFFKFTARRGIGLHLHEGRRRALGAHRIPGSWS